MAFVANFVRFAAVQKCENRLRFDKVTESLKLVTFLRHSVDLRRYVCHLVKLIWRHNFVGDHPICIKFGRPVQNHKMPMTVKSSSKPGVEFNNMADVCLQQPEVVILWPWIEKSTRHNSLCDCPIHWIQTKFVSSLQNYMKMTINSSKSKPHVEFPHGVRLFSKCGSGSISAMDWDRKAANIKCKKLPFYNNV